MERKTFWAFWCFLPKALYMKSMYEQKITSGQSEFYEEFTESAFHGNYLQVSVGGKKLVEPHFNIQPHFQKVGKKGVGPHFIMLSLIFKKTVLKCDDGFRLTPLL